MSFAVSLSYRGGLGATSLQLRFTTSLFRTLGCRWAGIFVFLIYTDSSVACLVSGSRRRLRGPHLEGRQDRRLPLRFVLRQQCPCSVGAGESGLILSEEGNSACLSSCSGSLSPLVELCVETAGVSGRSRLAGRFLATVPLGKPR